MADYVLIRKSRNMLSSFLHVFLNLVLAIGSIYITFKTTSVVLGLVLVLLSKWRMFAVRPRYWVLNLKSNLVDLIVGCSFVVITFCSGTTFMPVHIILAILYSLWLVFVKSKSTELAINIQALSAIFFGTIALTMLTASSNPIFMVIGTGLIGYSAARHILAQGEEENYEVIILAGAVIAAEIAWLCRSWLIVYSFSGTGIIIPQLTIIMLIISYLFGFAYKSISRNENKINWGELAMPTFFAILLIAVIVIGFSKPIFNV